MKECSNFEESAESDNDSMPLEKTEAEHDNSTKDS